MRAWTRGAALAVLLPALAACAPMPEVLAPTEHQVVQRQQGWAWVEVRGHNALAVRSLEVSAVLGEARQTPWTALTLETSGPGQAFHGRLRVQQGGWYRLEMRRDGGRPFTAVRRFGVGDVYVLAGQSNATNTGSGRQPGVNDRVAMFDGRRWWRAADPLVGVQDRSRHGSPWTWFGDLVQRSTGVPVGLAAVGHGATLVADWHPARPPVSGHIESSRYPVLRDRVQALGGARAVLWHQGESDARNGTATGAYVQAFLDMRQALVEDTGFDLPWFVARASYLPGLDEASMAAVRQAQEDLWALEGIYAGPSTDTMQGALRSRDRVHFSSAGLRVHGEHWFAAILAAWPETARP